MFFFNIRDLKIDKKIYNYSFAITCLLDTPVGVIEANCLRSTWTARFAFPTAISIVPTFTLTRTTFIPTVLIAPTVNEDPSYNCLSNIYTN